MYSITHIHRGETEERPIYLPGSETYRLTEAVLQMECGKSGQLTMTMPADNPARGELKCLTDEVIFYRDGTELWRGRALTEEQDFYLSGEVLCEGMLSYLCDTWYPPYRFGGPPRTLLQDLLDNHNSQVEEEKRIYLGEMTVTDPNDYIVRSDIYYERTIDVLSEKFPGSSLGGYVRIRMENGKRMLDYLAQHTDHSGQMVRLGENLLDISTEVEYDEMATVLLPLGARDEETGEYVTVESVNGGSLYIVNQEAVARYGWIVKCVIWEDVTLPKNLIWKAAEYFYDAVKPLKRVTVKAVDLRLTGANVDAMELGQWVAVSAPPHGVEEELVLTQMTVDALYPERNTLTFGKTMGYTDETLQRSRNIQENLSRMGQSISDGNRELSQKYSQIEQSVDAIRGTVGVMEHTLEEKADGSVVETLENRVAAVEVTADGISSTVSAYREGLGQNLLQGTYEIPYVSALANLGQTEWYLSPNRNYCNMEVVPLNSVPELLAQLPASVDGEQKAVYVETINTQTKPSRVYNYISTLVPLREGNQYTVSCHLYVAPGGAGRACLMSYLRPVYGSGTVQLVLKDILLEEGYNYVTATGTIPDGFVREDGCAYLMFVITWAAGDNWSNLYWTAPKLEVGDTATAYSQSAGTERGLISRINQSAEAVTIDASKINLKGAVTAEMLDAENLNVSSAFRLTSSVSGMEAGIYAGKDENDYAIVNLGLTPRTTPTAGGHAGISVAQISETNSRVNIYGSVRMPQTFKIGSFSVAAGGNYTNHVTATGLWGRIQNTSAVFVTTSSSNIAASWKIVDNGITITAKNSGTTEGTVTYMAVSLE